MTLPKTSVIIVSRHRPDALRRCVLGVSQLYHPAFEIVVVADPKGLGALDRAGWTGRIKTVAFDEANISDARNRGIAVAAGQVIAFIDDDSVPEPTWLSRLVAPFEMSDVGAAGGFVRARNGISFQWKARDIRSDGQSLDMAVDPAVPTILAGGPGRGIKTEGTNMAFRRDVLAQAGGFDPAFRFYLDESDLNLRLARNAIRTAIVPMAQVHHGFAASARRRPDRVPRDLSDIGASLAVFLRRHDPAALETRKAAERQAQHDRLISHMIAGRIEPRDVRPILLSFDRGWQDGLDRPTAPLARLGDPQVPFLPFRSTGTDLREHRVVSARTRAAVPAREEARVLAEQGYRVSLYLFSPGLRYHQVRFDHSGVWVQSGGLFGRSDRSDPLFRPWRFQDRLDREIARDSLFRMERTLNT